MKKALFLAGGWEGHHPDRSVQLFAKDLESAGLQPEIVKSLDPLADAAALQAYALVFPCWTMGPLTPEQEKGLVTAVRAGVGLGGIHGGMGDAFRGRLDYEWMTGGHFVGHPYVGDYSVRVVDRTHPATEGLPADFAYRSEQYYMLVDPGIHLLADTQYVHEGRTVTMPVAWTKMWGKGRVFYQALGHQPEEFAEFPEARRLTVQGCLWAAGLR